MTTKLQTQLAEFHHVYEMVDRETPGIPPDDIVRLRLRLIAEEFLELLAASTIDVDDFAAEAKRNLDALLKTSPIRVDLPEFADACGDLDYVIEGARQAFGIDGEPIADAIHLANMAKLYRCAACDGNGGKAEPCDACGGRCRVVRKNEFGKVIKPEGWTPPDIAGELRKQGWR